jgi:threonine dehydratase
MIEVLCQQQTVKKLISSSGGNAGHAVATAGEKIGLPVGMAMVTV